MIKLKTYYIYYIKNYNIVILLFIFFFVFLTIFLGLLSLIVVSETNLSLLEEYSS